MRLDALLARHSEGASQFSDGVSRFPIREPFDHEQVNRFLRHCVCLPRRLLSCLDSMAVS